MVYVKNEDYVPRDELPSGFAGGKVAKVDRVEWIYIPDQNTAVQALVTGEVDMIEIPPTDFLPILAASPDITVKTIDRSTQAIMRPNHLIPPFDHPAARQALLYLAGDQSAYLAAMIGNPTTRCRAGRCSSAARRSRASRIGDWAKGDREANSPRPRSCSPRPATTASRWC